MTVETIVDKQEEVESESESEKEDVKETQSSPRVRDFFDTSRNADTPNQCVLHKLTLSQRSSISAHEMFSAPVSSQGRRRCVGSRVKAERETSSKLDKRGGPGEGENYEEQQREVRRRSNRRNDDSERGSDDDEEDEDDEEEEEGERRRADR